MTPPVPPASAPLPLVRSMLLAQFPQITAAMSTRQGGAPGDAYGFNLGFGIGDPDHVEANLREFLARCDLMPDEAAFMQQVHGADIAFVSEAGIHEGVDAMITRTPHLALAVRTADCAPVLLYAPAARAVAAVHAGWKGLAERIVERTVAELHVACQADPGDILAFIGAAARGCCYEVDEEVAAQFPGSAVTRRPQRKPTVDLQEVVRQQLIGAGVAASNIDAEERCTICSPALFHSHRRDGARAGRMLAIVALNGDDE